MIRRLACLFALPLLLAVLVCTSTNADVDQPPPVDPTALIEQLGADSFEAREAAYAELAKLGKAAKKAIEDGAFSDDLEIRSRCKSLLKLLLRTDTEVVLHAMLAGTDMKAVQKLPGWQHLQPLWERFSKLLGDDQSARTLFVEMYTSENALFGSLDSNPRTFNAAFNRRCTQIQQNLYSPTGDTTPIPLGQIVGLMFVATDPRAIAATPEPGPGGGGRGKGGGPRIAANNVFLMTTSLLETEGLQDAFRSHAGARKLLVHFLEQRSDANTMQQALSLASQLEIKEMIPLVLKTATNKNAKKETRAIALLTLAKLGSRENLKDIEPLLSDSTSLVTTQLGNGRGAPRITVQMGDVALATMITLSGQSLSEYEFPYLKNLPLQPDDGLVYNFLGFSNQTQRVNAVKKFKDSQEQEKK